MANRQHIEWLLEGVGAWNARRERDDFVPDFEGLDLARLLYQQRKDLPENQQSRHLLVSVNLSRANLRYASLDLADLRYANFNRADLSFAKLFSVVLIKANLTEATLKSCQLIKSNLSEADLRGADLSNASLESSFLSGADLRTFVGRDETGKLSILTTNLSTAKYLKQDALNETIGDQGVVLPSRTTINPPAHWPPLSDTIAEFIGEAAPRSHIDNELELPLIKASAVDFQITDAGVEATPPEGQDLSQITFTGDCLQRSTALITTARDIAASVSNKLGEDTREDLLRYANHLENSESGNPHYLVSTCVGIRADLDDPFVSDALGHRLTRKLENFLSQHNDFLAHCLPATAEAVQVKADTHPTREVTKEEATAVLNTLEEAIAQAEASTESYSKVIAEFRAFDDHLNDLKIKAFHPGEIERLRNAVQRETVELGAFGARLYWRAKQVVSRARLHAGDIAIAGTISGKTGEQMAAAVVQYLEPLMRKLGELFTALPPL